MTGANAATGNGLVTGLRRGLVEGQVRRFREHAERARVERLARMTWAEEGRHEPADPDRGARDAGSTPLRWTRLT